MVAHLKSAVDRYSESDKEWHIHPISKEDAEIISEIIALFKKMNFTDAVSILQDYKKISDEDVYLNLLELNTNIGRKKANIESQEAETPLFQRYLLTVGRRIDMFLIICYDSLDIEPPNNSLKYCIQLNPTPKEAKQIPYYANEILIYDTPEDRDAVLAKMDGYMKLYRGMFLD